MAVFPDIFELHRSIRYFQYIIKERCSSQQSQSVAAAKEKSMDDAMRWHVIDPTCAIALRIESGSPSILPEDLCSPNPNPSVKMSNTSLLHYLGSAMPKGRWVHQ
jgi:hypothetical protein